MGNLKKNSAILLLFVFLGQFLGSSLFPHTHVYRGVVVAHSHPYNIFSHHQHQHSEQELLVIHKLSHAVFTSPVILWVGSLPCTILLLVLVENVGHAKTNSIRHHSTRAPPFLFFQSAK